MTGIGDSVPKPIAFDKYNRFRAYVSVEEGVCAFFGSTFLADRQWRAAVVSEEFSPNEADDVSAACKLFNYKNGFVLDIDHFDSGFFFKMNLSAEKLSMLENTFVTPSYLLVEEKERFMLVSDSDYYWSIAGDQRFLEQCFKRSLDVVDREFVDATRTYRDSGSRIGRSLSKIATEAMGPALPAV